MQHYAADDVGKSVEAAIRTEMAVYESSGVIEGAQFAARILLSIRPGQLKLSWPFLAPNL